MPNKFRSEIRDLRDGDWYWIPKVVIQEYLPKVGAAGIVVYNFLASLADKSQSCFPSQKYIAQCLGYSRSYISEVLKRLEKNGLIKIEKRDRYHKIYQLVKVRCRPERTQMSTILNSDVNQSDTNNNYLTKYINKSDKKEFIDLKFNAFKRFRPETREELLALDLAQALADQKNLALYLSYAKKYPESFLRGILAKVAETPFERIKKSQASLFNYLVKKYAQRAS